MCVESQIVDYRFHVDLLRNYELIEGCWDRCCGVCCIGCAVKCCLSGASCCWCGNC